MKRLVVFIGDKGGAGKSFACRAYVDVLRRRGVKPYLVDADGEVGHLLRYYGRRDSDGRLSREQGADGVRLFRLHADERDRVDLAEILDAGRDLIVLDLPAASVTLLRRVEEDYGFFRLAHEAGYAVTMVVVVTPEEASMASVRGAIELDPCADLVFARNLAFGDAQDFLVWDGSEREAVPPAKGKALLAQLIAEGRGWDLSLPKLNPGTVALVGAKKLTFSAAAALDSPLHSGRRSQVGTWLAKVEAEFARAGEALALGEGAARKAAAS